MSALAIFLATPKAMEAYETLGTARAIVSPVSPYPDYLQPVIDVAFGTSFTRVTDPGQEILPGIYCKVEYCTHRYSSSQAWNADQSLLVIANGCSGLCFLDGATYTPLFHRTAPNECEWHPVNPALMICVSDDESILGIRAQTSEPRSTLSLNTHICSLAPTKATHPGTVLNW
jgi:hypothetical protein